MNAIETFTKITLTISGMRSVEEYEIVCNGDESTVSAYSIFYCAQEDGRRLENSSVCKTDTVTALLNKCRVHKWNGFRGANPFGVRDGFMFSFKAEINSGQTISASGSNNFPKGYNEFTAAVKKLLEK